MGCPKEMTNDKVCGPDKSTGNYNKNKNKNIKSPEKVQI
jgi:hypothetical protein